jgi:hypothetical protein
VADSFVCVADTDSSMAPTTIVPDSARLQDSPPPFSDASRMPGLMSFTGKAGDAMLMGIRTWHAAMPNSSNLPRESIIIQFAASKWQQTGTMISSAKRLERQRAEFLAPRPILRQMLGLGIAPELADTGSFPTEEEVGRCDSHLHTRLNCLLTPLRPTSDWSRISAVKAVSRFRWSCPLHLSAQYLWPPISCECVAF